MKTADMVLDALCGLFILVIFRGIYWMYQIRDEKNARQSRLEAEERAQAWTIHLEAVLSDKKAFETIGGHARIFAIMANYDEQTAAFIWKTVVNVMNSPLLSYMERVGMAKNLLETMEVIYEGDFAKRTDRAWGPEARRVAELTFDIERLRRSRKIHG